MKEIPIIFSTEMVRAILDGRKTQTRRIIKHPQKYDNIRGCDFCCPYGQAGDRLWVRETFKCWILAGAEPITVETISLEYKAGGLQSFQRKWTSNKDTCLHFHKWTPSIFMPRWASRITLEITEVRVARLQEISEEDAEDESFVGFADSNIPTAKDHFRVYWDSLNAKRGYGWEINPWVWRIQFKRLRE